MASEKPKCMACARKPARKGSFFCTQKCAAKHAEALARFEGAQWNETEGRWLVEPEPVE